MSRTASTAPGRRRKRERWLTYPTSWESVPSRSRKIAGRAIRLEGSHERARLRRHAVGSDAPHAAMVDRALAQPAGRAMDALAHHAVALADGMRLPPVGGAEDGHHRHPEGGREVHGARVVRDQDAQAPED